MTAHPRVCGENSYPLTRDLVTIGSSPPAWGNRLKPLTMGLHLWPIPTARGENVLTALFAYAEDGQSPRPWGKRLVIDLLCIWQRLVLTPVGKTR